MATFFDTALQRFVEEHFGERVSIVRDGAETTTPAIRERIVHDYYDPFGGSTTTYEIVFDGFGLRVRLEYLLHDLSGQIDTWNVEATIPEALAASMARLSEPKQYDRFPYNQGLLARVRINGRDER